MNVILYLIGFFILIYFLRLFLMKVLKKKKCPKCELGYTERTLDEDKQFIRKCDSCDYTYKLGVFLGGDGLG